ncbi:hypothetical protein C8J57DRAFT_1321597 [Mycena rebaudengoi]|nr:hypothetical protein C8J57DRAFT_1321597 [Mycena rebaudengoi]
MVRSLASIAVLSAHAAPTKLILFTPDILWQRYQEGQAYNAARRAEHDSHALLFGDKIMRYAAFTIGDKPSKGYPLYIALHGGGGAPPSSNDSQWKHMHIYYRDSVKNGIYVAPRGVTDTWDLHFQPESYVLLERLIENMVLYENADPDRVYLLGFSAGGDGVYQLTPRLADRFAAANMSAGHPNGTNLVNLASVPLLLQVGENDSAYHRNTVTAEYNDKLNALAASGNGEYVHEAFIHAGRPHNFLDNDASERPRMVLANPHAWLTEGNRFSHSNKQANTNAIRWLEQHTRNPYPERVVWDLTTRAQRESNGLWYWLDIGKHTRESLGTDTIVTSYDSARNAIVVEQARTYLRILVNSAMVDLDKSVLVEVGGQILNLQVTPSKRVQEETLLERGDPRYVFAARITLMQYAAGWHAE